MPTVRWSTTPALWAGDPIGWPDIDPEVPLTDTVALELGDTTLILDETEGLVCTVLDLGWPDVRVVTTAHNEVDGAIDTTSRFGARPVTIAVAALDTDARTWKDALARLARFLSADARPTLHVYLNGNDFRIGLAPDVAAAPFEFPNHARAQLAFRAPDPFLYKPQQSVDSGSFRAGTTGRTYSWTPPRTYPASDAISGQFTATNGGTSVVWPVVNVWGPLATTLSLANETTGDTFVIGSTVNLDAGHRLEIDMRNRTVRVDGNPDQSRFSLVDFSTSRWVRLVTGDNLLQFRTGATSDAVCSVEWSDPHLWPGGLL